MINTIFIALLTFLASLVVLGADFSHQKKDSKTKANKTECRRCNWLIRQRVERIVGLLHIGHIERADAQRRLRMLMLNDTTVARLVNRVPGTIQWRL